MNPTKKAADMSVQELAAYIDHAILKPEFTVNDVRKHIQEGIDIGCRTVCINPASLPLAGEMTKGTGTAICVVCDFPFGQSTTRSKVLQAEEYCKRGDVFELDIVANYGFIRSGLWDAVREDLKAVNDACHSFGTAVKVIFETDALTIDEVKRVTEVAIEAGSDFIKTSTGFFAGGRSDGATIEVVRAMMDTAQGRCKIKASGGIRTREYLAELIDMGIDRVGIGCTSTPGVLGLNNAQPSKGSGY